MEGLIIFFFKFETVLFFENFIIYNQNMVASVFKGINIKGKIK